MATGQDRPAIEVRPLETLAELGEAVRLQKQIWGFEDIELLPLRLFVVAQKVGGQTLGAFDGERMVAFLLAIPGLKKEQMYLHSHMMGVLEEYRNLGVGRMLKLRQRELALERGIGLIEWTFDPLEIKNAFFNMQRLGAVVRRFVLNQYGTTTSHLHGGLPTDRCVAEWHIDGPRARAIVEGRDYPPGDVCARIAVPANIGELRESDPETARGIQTRVSGEFVKYFGEGLAVIGFERNEQSGIYLLGPWNSK